MTQRFMQVMNQQQQLNAPTPKNPRARRQSYNYAAMQPATLLLGNIAKRKNNGIDAIKNDVPENIGFGMIKDMIDLNKDLNEEY